MWFIFPASRVFTCQYPERFMIEALLKSSGFSSALLLLTLVSSNAQQKPSLTTVAVIDFRSTGDLTKNESATLTNRFRGQLVQTGSFKVLERAEMDEILKEQDLILSDACNTTECAVQVGQLLGVKSIIAGDIGKIGSVFTIDIRMIDVETSNIVRTVNRDYKGDVEGLLDVMRTIAFEFAGKASASVTQVGKKSNRWLWIAGGAAVIGGGAYLILGKKSGGDREGISGAQFPPNP